MTDPTPTQTIVDYLSKDEMKPITKNRTSINISEFRESVGNALTNITSVYTEKVTEDLGHAYLIDKEHHYRKRREDTTASLPEPQPRPEEPPNQNAYEQKIYLYNIKPYRLSRALDKEVRLLTTKRFPSSLGGLVCPATWSLPASITTRAAFDYYIERTVQATTTGNMRHQELLQALITREYEPGISTAETYF
mmetsp:Transcript_14479/g.30797  ORF Transcript_14479/g.30797 Transcript_14479/m.30797 type:complete len:193 (-) Transcript_14479:923-1501(-)